MQYRRSMHILDTSIFPFFLGNYMRLTFSNNVESNFEVCVYIGKFWVILTKVVMAGVIYFLV